MTRLNMFLHLIIGFLNGHIEERNKSKEWKREAFVCERRGHFNLFEFVLITERINKNHN